MTMLSAATSVIGGAIQAAGAMQAAEAEAQAHEYNAAVAARNRKVIGQQVKATVRDEKLTSRRINTSIRANYAANGIAYHGSAMDVMLDTIKEQRLDIAKIKYRGKLMKIETIDQENLELMGADNARAAGSISAAAAILGGVAGGLNAITRTV